MLLLAGAAEGAEESLDLRALGQRVLRTALRAGKRGRGIGERNGLLERAARRQAHRQRPVESA